MLQNEILLGVNIDHVATIRQARKTRYPDPIQAAMMAEEGGADGITLHLREDRRHIQDRDVFLLKDILLTRMNLEMAVTEEMLALAEKVKPYYCCLVPERREELTTEGGLDVLGNIARVKDACARLKASNIHVSLFIAPDIKQIDAALDCAAPIIEIHTGNFADADSDREREETLKMIIDAAQYAKKSGLQVNAGHGLNYQNVKPIAAIPEITELNIGHGIVARAIFTGFKNAVSEMKQLMLEARSNAKK